MDDEYNFGLEGYCPHWVEYEDAPVKVAKNLTPFLGSSIQDINGVISPDGWEPDWPLVFVFDSGSFAINAKCDLYWSIERWDDYRFHDETEEMNNANMILSYESVTKSLDLSPILNDTIRGVSWPQKRGYEEIQSFLLRFENADLRVFDAGDKLGIELITNYCVETWENII